MMIRLKRRYLRLLLGTIVYLTIGLLIDEEGFVWWVAIGLFWLVVTVVEDAVRSRRALRKGPHPDGGTGDVAA